MLLRVRPVTDRHLFAGILARCCRTEIEGAQAGKPCRRESGGGYERRRTSKDDT
jgi:hypothetical protein